MGLEPARNMKDLEKIQIVNYMLLDEMDRICKKAQIPYFLFAGTLLGSVREQKFIPWDDDADVGMLREDFERFVRVAKEEVREPFAFVMPEEVNGFFDMIPKLVYTKSSLHNQNKEDVYYGEYHECISLDIYILDHAAKNRLSFAIQVFRLKMIYGMMMRERFGIDLNKYSFLERNQVRVLRVLGKPFSIDKLRKRYQKICDGHQNSDVLFTSNSVLQKIDVRFEKEWFSECAEGKLGDRTYSIPAGYDGILRNRYGDYMVPKKENFMVKHRTKNQVRAWVDGKEL